MYGWSAQQGFIAASLKQDFPGLSVQFVHVFDEEFKERLTAAKGTAAYPDVIFGLDAVPGWWQSGLGVTMLGEPSQLEYSRLNPDGIFYRPGAVDLLRAAPHGDVARAFWVWMTRALLCRSVGCDVEGDTRDAEEPVRIARGALRDVLEGVALGGSADKDAAEFLAGSAQRRRSSPPGAMVSRVLWGSMCRWRCLLRSSRAAWLRYRCGRRRLRRTRSVY